jgi:succinate dehydrogenase/fumarate reductase flavoprotein subunit
VTVAHHGLHVVLPEKEDAFGGMTAWSGGWIWAPCNPVALRHGLGENPARPRRYLEAVLGETFNGALVEAFLAGAPSGPK